MPSPNQPHTIKFVLLGEIERDRIIESPDGESVVVRKRSVVPSKKNQKEAAISLSGHPYIRPNPKYIKWKKEHDVFFRELYNKLFYNQRVRLPIARCNIKVLFYYPNSQDRDNHNKFETIADMLKEHEVIASDSFKVFHETILRGVVKRDKPRTEVYITIIEPSHQDYGWDLTSESYHELQRKKKAIQRKNLRSKGKSLR